MCRQARRGVHETWGWDGMGWDGMGWDGMGWDVIGCARHSRRTCEAGTMLGVRAFVVTVEWDVYREMRGQLRHDPG